MREALVVLFCLVVVAALEGAFYLARFFSERREEQLKRRLRVLGGPESGPGLLRRERYASSPALDRFVRGLPGAAQLEGLLSQADSPLTVAQLLTWSLAAALLGLTLPLSLRVGLAPAVALGAFLGVLPCLLVCAARARRNARLSEQLPDALEMMVRSLRAGHAMPAAFRLVASEMPTPVSVEFGRAYEEQNLGLSVEGAVVNMTARCPLNRDLKIFAVSVMVQKETGGNLAEILDNIASTIRERYRFYAKLRSLTAEGRASGLVLGALPPAMLLFLLVANRAYLVKLFDNPMGQLILLYAALSWVAGGLWMQRMSDVEY
ncbi:MAG TPA: type II secretion system protein [Myxococcales bacterium]|jgi:tight adherence protein B|nr:type II secretion system protein [Myxococcales bacterium]